MARKRTPWCKVDIDFDKEGRLMFVNPRGNPKFFNWLKETFEWLKSNPEIEIDVKRKLVIIAPYEGVPIPPPPINPMCGDLKRKVKDAVLSSPGR